jgi:GT2 family glycosyltransferase
MSTGTVRGLSSIIIPCWNQHEFTQRCIAALKEHTRPAWELVVIDNGSTDGTAIYLEGARDMAAVPVTVISNATNLGFPAAINQGLQLARGEYLVLLNNDVVVTDGWLDQLIALASTKRDFTLQHAETNAGRESGMRRGAGAFVASREGEPPCEPSANAGSDRASPSRLLDGVGQGTSCAETTPPPSVGRVLSCAETTPPGPPFARGGKGSLGRRSPSSLPTADCLLPTPGAIGLVGPMSNYAAPPQLVDRVPYRDIVDMHHFARRWRDEHRGKWFTVPKLSGFCLLLKRAVYEAVGELDERFGLGFFDDDDLAERARRAGFELAVAHDLFVHHFGSRTFVGNGIDAGKLLDANARRFADKWGLNGTGGKRVALKPFIDRGSEIADSIRRIPDSRKTAEAEHDDSSAPSLPLGIAPKLVSR